MNRAEIDNRFGYHPPATDEEVELHATIRAKLKSVARFMDRKLPDGREKSLVLTNIEQAMFWANASVARQISAPKNAEARK